ncbi:hypothetical protein ACHAW6_004213, partial [Cyclotella cf. meneghiniana]
EYITNVLIPATNIHFKGDVLTLVSFRLSWDATFHVVFYGISDFCLWCSKKPIDMFEVAQFCLKDFISCNCFIAITEAIRISSMVLITITRQPTIPHCSMTLMIIDESMNSWMNRSSPSCMLCQGSHIHLEIHITLLQMVMMGDLSCGGSIYRRVRTLANGKWAFHLCLTAISRQQSS